MTAAALMTNARPHKPKATPPKPLRKKPLPAGRPREWYISHNRRLKAMRLAIALMDSGVYVPEKATNRKIRDTAARVGIHPPSNTTCRMVRELIRDEMG
ncbi:hypothetical protein GCM10010329_13850 [Streptomyces spiroverticillatus]|uniref:Uncharacterized protein n=2 Tax=Streptomyces finlayi TaxID=67296 RepID=A0A918X2R5_9ACTN|nr:hypothetical protein GCM10010329_13850 [Streptomyces spiroverticillatus]GHD06423.1 hypothetical protein GCM10010334_57890 [Streptomyces finlayi]